MAVAKPFAKGPRPAVQREVKDVRPARRGLRRPVSALAFFGIPVLLLALLGGAGYLMYQEIQRETPERIPPQKVAEFQRKRATLSKARTLRVKGQYAESIAVYDKYLQRYPNSLAAKQGRAASVAQLERASKPAARQQPAAVSSEQRKPEKERRGVRDRVRRIFRRGS